MSLRARLLYAGGRVYWWLFRPVTMGVRLLLIQDNRVALVKHTYQPEWFLPGGGVKRNETLEEVARREAQEEVGATLGELRFFGIYSNLHQTKSDHIVVFACSDFVVSGTTDYEIEQFDMFPFDDLPVDISGGSRRRIEEYLNGNRRPGVSLW